jgi:hypothetical protein
MIPHSVPRTLSSQDFSPLLDRLDRTQIAELNRLVWSGKDFTYRPKPGITVTGKGSMVVASVGSIGSIAQAKTRKGFGGGK